MLTASTHDNNNVKQSTAAISLGMRLRFLGKQPTRRRDNDLTLITGKN